MQEYTLYLTQTNKDMPLDNDVYGQKPGNLMQLMTSEEWFPKIFKNPKSQQDVCRGCRNTVVILQY